MQAWLQQAKAGLLGRPAAAADRAVIFDRGDPAARTYLLAAGALEIRQTSEAGLSSVVKILVGPALFGQTEPLAGEPEYLESVVALGRVTFYAMERRRFTELVRGDAALGYECLVDMGRAFCVKARFEAPQLFQTEALLANLLIAYAELFGERRRQRVVIGLRRTQADLAEAIGAGERSVNRILATWKHREIITKEKARYILCNELFLRETAGDLVGSLVHRAASATTPE